MRRIWSIGMVALGLALGASALVSAEQAQDASKIDATMKTVGPAFGALRKGLEGGSLDLVKTNGAALSKAFVEAEGFFKSHGKTDGVEWAQGAKKAADSLASAATLDAAKASAGELGKFCQGCHTKYRDKAADGTYSFKPGN
jgi:cytochrome c556